ncbi:MAG: ABC transporter ATP-binding protein [Anaerolineae bacterium]|jgi:putative ABC transport system ATP-binding protein|nr:ABC transporter ATP-binding protein [Anaerolineae bacterium]
MAFISVRNLKKYYEMGTVTVKALDGVDLDLDHQSMAVVMGPSGSGKSTLLHLLGGLDRPTTGEIHVNGGELTRMDENDLAVFRRETVGFVFQAFNLIETLTAVENVGLPMRFMNIPKKLRHEKAMHYMEEVGIADRADHRPSELSGGQQQRVAIARALVNEPTMILADEPTGNLDSASGLSIMEILAQLNQSGRTVLIVTHDPRIGQFTDHIIHILDGVIVPELSDPLLDQISSQG